jgi:hypothetical protein
MRPLSILANFVSNFNLKIVIIITKLSINEIKL